MQLVKLKVYLLYQIKNNMTKLSKELAAQMYNSGNEHFKAFALENYPELDKPKYAMKWQDLGEKLKGYYLDPNNNLFNCNDTPNKIVNHNIYPTLELTKAAQVLPLLLQFRNQWWEVDGWDVKNANEWAAISNTEEDGLYSQKYYNRHCIFSFKDSQTAQLFLDTFRPMLEIAKPLL